MDHRSLVGRSAHIAFVLCLPIAATAADRYTAEKCPDLVYTIGCDRDPELGWIKRGSKRLEATDGSSTNPQQPPGAGGTRRKTLPRLAKDNPGGTETLQAAAAGSLALDQGLGLLIPKARAIAQPGKDAGASPVPAGASPKVTPEQKERAQQLLRSAGFRFDAMSAASAEPRLVQATQIDPENAEAWYELAQVRSWKKPRDEAGSLEAARMAVDLVPTHGTYWSYLAGSYAFRGQRDLAVATWELGMASATHPPFVDELLRNYNKDRQAQGLPPATLAEARANATKRTWEPVTAAGKQRRAREIYASIHGKPRSKDGVTLRPDSPGYAAIEQRMLEAVQMDPGAPNYWAELGLIREGAGNSAGVVEAYEKAVALYPRNQNWWKRLGDAQRTLKNCPAAVRSYRAALALPAENPNIDDTRFMYASLGECLATQGQQDEALLAFEQSALIFQPSNYGLDKLNQFRLSKGLKPATLDELKTAQSRRATQTAEALAQAVALEKAGQWPEAEAAARTILERQPAEAGARQLLARLVRDVPPCREAAVFTDAWAAEQWRVKKAADTLRGATEGLGINIGQACVELEAENRAAETMLNAAGRYRYLMEQCVKQTGTRAQDEQALGELNTFIGEHRERANSRWTAYQNLCRDVRCAIYGQGC